MDNVPLMALSKMLFLIWPLSMLSHPFRFNQMEPYSTEPNIFTEGMYGRSSTHGMEIYSGKLFFKINNSQ